MIVPRSILLFLLIQSIYNYLFYPGFNNAPTVIMEMLLMTLRKKKKGYNKTHLGTYRYRCKKTKTGYPVSMVGNYESLFSFKELPKYTKMKEHGRKWIYIKNYKPVMDRIVLDVDCDGDLEKAHEVTKAIMQDFTDIADCINVYYSGKKGFHIEILTEEIDIVDTTAERPMYACMEYVEFLNYYEDKFNEVDLSLKDVGTRILRIHHTKHESTGNYKILVDINASLQDIQKSSADNEDMVKAAENYLSKEKTLLLLHTYSKPVEKEEKPKTAKETPAIDGDYSIIATVFNELNTNLHDKIKLIGSGLNGYVNETELEAIYDFLSETTDIDDSNNAKQSLIDVYNEDRKPFNLGALYNHYDKHNLDPDNFFELSEYLDLKHNEIAYNEFNQLFDEYNQNWFKMLEKELYDYVDNTENIFNGIIQSLSALFGYGSRFIVVNGGAEVGKSEYVNTIEKLMPFFMDLGSSTPASVRRKHEFAFNKKIVYLGDKGLKGKDDEEFKGLQEVFGGLITENKFKRDIVIGDKVMQFNLKSKGVCVFYTEPYTNLRVFGAGDQYSTRSTFITVNPVKDGLSVFLQDETQENPFYPIHKNYIKYILKNPIELKISNKVKTEIYYYSKSSLRTAKYLLGLFKAYCQYIKISEPGISDVEDFIKVFKPYLDITDIEYLVYEKLYNNLKPITESELVYKFYDDGSIKTEDMLLQTKNRETKIFFTAKQIKTYFKNDFKHNKNLKDTLDQVPDILTNLYNAGYVERIDWQYNGQNVYYFLKKGGDTK